MPIEPLDPFRVQHWDVTLLEKLHTLDAELVPFGPSKVQALELLSRYRGEAEARATQRERSRVVRDYKRADGKKLRRAQ